MTFFLDPHGGLIFVVVMKDHDHIIMKISKMDKNDYVSYFYKVIPMVCEKYVARINIPVPPHHEEPMNRKND
jgi:hypothetical protein